MYLLHYYLCKKNFSYCSAYVKEIFSIALECHEISSWAIIVTFYKAVFHFCAVLHVARTLKTGLELR